MLTLFVKCSVAERVLLSAEETMYVACSPFLKDRARGMTASHRHSCLKLTYVNTPMTIGR